MPSPAVAPAIMGTFLPYLTALKEVVVMVAAATGAIVAVKGLTAWKRQLAGKTEYEVALKFLRAVYKVRDAISQVRNPFMSVAEIATALKETDMAPESDPGQVPGHITQAATYTVRWKTVTEAWSDLQITILEAEALWGEQVVKLVSPLRKCVSELNVSINMYLRDSADPKGERTFREHHEKVFQVLYWVSDDSKEDSFSGKMQEAVRAVESFIRPQLK